MSVTNEFKLGNNAYLDAHFKPIKVGDEITPLELTNTEFKVNGDLTFTGKLKQPLIEADGQYLHLKSSDYIRLGSDNGFVDIYPFGGTTFFIAPENNNFQFIGANGGTFDFGDLTQNVTLFRLDSVNGKLQILNVDDTNDNFTLDVNNHGATIMSTTDNAVTQGDLTFSIQGDINIDSHTGLIYLKDNDTTFGLITTSAGKSGLILYEAAGASTDDFFFISVTTQGSTLLSTTDAAGTSANLNMDIDGDITIDSSTGNITAKDNGGNYTPTSDYHVATKKYVDDNAGGGGSSKTYLDWYYYQASLSSNNVFYVSLHHDEFGVTSIANTNISDYDDTTAEDMWRIIRYAGRRIPYSGTVTKFMAHVEASGASADSDVEVGVWLASKPTLDTELASTTNMTIDNLGYMTFDFSSASRFLHKETTSFNATSVTQGDFMFITVRKTTGTDGTSFWIHSTVTIDIS